ncbi:MAG: adenine phosphoribosyltransferase [Gemmatimonas sp.]
MTESTVAERVRAAVLDVPDYPTPGILFKDIMPVLADPMLMRDVLEMMTAPFEGMAVTHVVGIESRGFLFGVPMALALGTPFVPARKIGKLPRATVRESYALEYRSDALEMQADALGNGARVLVVDDVLATGGTAAAACRLVERVGGEIVGLSVLLELSFLHGRDAVPDRLVATVVRD